VVVVALMAGAAVTACAHSGTPLRHVSAQRTSLPATSSAAAPGNSVVPWKRTVWPTTLERYPFTIRDPRVPWCTAGDLRARFLGYNVGMQAGYRVMDLDVRKVRGAHPCGLRGYPRLDALSAEGTVLARPASSSQGATDPAAWVRLSAAHPRAIDGVNFPGDPAHCPARVRKFKVELGHGGGGVVIAVPKQFGCLSSHDDGTPYPAYIASWDTPKATELKPYQNVNPSLVDVQRRVPRGGLEHFSLHFTGNVNLILHPCLPVSIDLLPDGPPVVASVRTLLNCGAVPNGRLNQVTFKMQIRVPRRRIPKVLEIDVDWPVSLSDISDVLDDGQFLPIKITN
jgi:Protein of unknown function (DUF4232)